MVVNDDTLPGSPISLIASCEPQPGTPERAPGCHAAISLEYSIELITSADLWNGTSRALLVLLPGLFINSIW